MACNECPVETCPHSSANIGVGSCPRCDEVGFLCLNPISQQLDCSVCNVTIMLPKAKSMNRFFWLLFFCLTILLFVLLNLAKYNLEISVLPGEVDEETGDKLLEFIFEKVIRLF